MLEILQRFRNLSSIDRFNVFRRMVKESVAEHSYFTALICMMVADELVENGACKVDVEKLLRTALVHDLEELTTSDIPSHVKHSSKEVYEVFVKLQRQAFYETIEGLPRTHMLAYKKLYDEQKGDDPEGRILALVDKFDMIIYCFQEVQLGNNYFRPMLKKAIRLTKGMQYYEQSSLVNKTVTQIEMIQSRGTGWED